MSKVKCLCNVRESVMLAPGVFSLWIDAPEIAESAVPGQFVSIYTKSEARLLPRPISICEINRGEKTMRFVYRVVGERKNFRNFLPVIRLRCLALWEMDSRFRKRKQS